MTFHGHDYVELAEHFGVAVKAGDDDVAQLTTWLNGQRKGVIWDAAVVAGCREFLGALIQEEDRAGLRSPFFRGLAAVKDDFSFMSLFLHNLEMFWT